MELRARVQIQGKPGRLGGRTKQTEAAWAKGVVPLRYFICVRSLRRAAAALQRQRRLSLAELQPKEKGGK